jgi:hypothetical protein
MPSALIVASPQRAAELAGNLEPECVRREDLSARGAGAFGDRESGRDHRRAGMAAQARQAVVEVERVSGDAVRERGFGRRGADVLAPAARLRLRAQLVHPPHRNLAGRFQRACQRTADRVDQRAAGAGDDVLRNVRGAGFGNEPCECFGDHVSSGVIISEMANGPIRRHCRMDETPRFYFTCRNYSSSC